VEYLDLKPVFIQSFEHLQSKPELFDKALDDFGNARRGFVVRAFIETLTKGNRTIGAAQKPIEQLSTDPLRFANFI
jgi:hypothetical protein